jgi:hypothetical protein
MTVSAVRPWRKALQRERRLPSLVVGPVLFGVLQRLASICLRELFENQTEQFGSFGREDGSAPLTRNFLKSHGMRSAGEVGCLWPEQNHIRYA